MTVKMSSEGDTSKNLSTEVNEKSGTDHTDSSQDSQDVEDLKSAKAAENNTEEDESDSKDKEDPKDEPNEEEEKPESGEAKKENDEKVENDIGNKPEKKEIKENDAHDDETENSAKTEEEEEEDTSDKESKDPKEKGKSKDVPLLDQPLEKSGKRERKNVQRFNEPPVEKETKIEIPNGSGIPLGEIPRIDASISRFKNDDLKMLHKILFKSVGKATLIKKNIKRFNGFDFKKGTEEFDKKLAYIQKLDMKNLKSICEMLDLPKTGNKEEVSERILGFLLEPADSGKPVGGGRPKRSAAVKANNRGYSSHDDYSSDEKPSRARRDKGKRTSLKDATSSESDEEFQPSDGSDEKPRVNKRKRTSRKKAKSDDEQSDEAAHSGASSDESDQDQPKGKRKKAAKANNKAKGKATPKRGRKPASATPKKTPKSTKKKAKESSEDEQSDHKDDGGSSSEDEPLAKKAKNANPPTDDEIKTYIKEILEGANLEEITMKNVCQQVYAHYPDFDLAHKKDFIKSTVKSLIST